MKEWFVHMIFIFGLLGGVTLIVGGLSLSTNECKKLGIPMFVAGLLLLERLLTLLYHII